jgi:hypothetical protein
MSELGLLQCTQSARQEADETTLLCGHGHGYGYSLLRASTGYGHGGYGRLRPLGGVSSSLLFSRKDDSARRRTKTMETSDSRVKQERQEDGTGQRTGQRTDGPTAPTTAASTPPSCWPQSVRPTPTSQHYLRTYIRTSTRSLSLVAPLVWLG